MMGGSVVGYRSIAQSTNTSLIMRILFIISSVALSLILFTPSTSRSDDDYKSPYKIEFTVPKEELTKIDSLSPRNNPRLASETPYEEWYSHETQINFGSWGPKARQFPAIPDFNKLSLEWKRQRVLITAEKWIGRPYQHHHIPDWDPPPSWPWKEVKFGRNSPGIDCSDFSSWVYNYGLGIELTTGIDEQAKLKEIKGPGGEGMIHVTTIYDKDGYDSLIKELRTADLLFIKNDSGIISHVIMWVGEYGKSPDGTPLVIDSTGTGHTDSNGVEIPLGVHLRPFTKNSWYYKSFAHANRILHLNEHEQN